MTNTELRRTATDLVGALQRAGARIAAPILAEDGSVREDTLREAIALFVDGRLLLEHDTGDEAIYKVLEERRLALEYYKNNLLHFFVPSALIGASLLADPRDCLPEAHLRDAVQRLSRAYKYEFMFRADADFDAIFDDALASMIAANEIERTDQGIRVTAGAGGERVAIYAGMIGTYFESYLLALRGASLLLDHPMGKKEWYKRTLSLGQRMYLAGEIERRESLSQLKLETALKALKDHELVVFGAQDVLSPGPQAKTREDLRKLEQLLAPFLRI